MSNAVPECREMIWYNKRAYVEKQAQYFLSLVQRAVSRATVRLWYSKTIRQASSGTGMSKGDCR